MKASSSSAQEPHRHLLFPHGTTAAPPPTPSSQPNLLSSDESTADALARLFHRLPTTLSLPSSRFSRRHFSYSSAAGETKPAVPTISLDQPRSDVLSAISTAASSLGFFQLTSHRVSAQLAESSESESAAILALSSDQKPRLFPANWPVGFYPEEEETANDENESFCVDLETLTSANHPDELSLESLTEFTRELDRVGVEVVDLLTCALDLENPLRVKENKCSLIWVSESDEEGKLGIRCYPYAVGLTYQIRIQEYRLETDTGPVLVNPQIGSVLVTLGDITQVWSNGKTKKIRGMPIPTTHENYNNSISMSLLITLPLDTTISPLLPVSSADDTKDLDVDDNQVLKEREKMIMKFNPIPFEGYAWRVYHESLFLKDSLDRYRI
ncbi:hypothetical protein V2J09_012526 [Rumex salicifolius]